MDSIQFYQPPFTNPLFTNKYTALRHAKGSQVLKSAGVIALDECGDFGSERDFGQDQGAVSEDDLPTLEELLRPTLPKKVLIAEPKPPKHTLQSANQQAWTRLVDVGDSQGMYTDFTLQ